MTEANTVAGLAARAASPQTIGATPVLALGEGDRVHSLENYLPSPTRRRGTMRLAAVASFVGYVNRYASASDTIVVSDHTAATITAVMNHHGPDGAAGWGDFQAVLGLEYSHQFKAWLGANGKRCSQHDFARFIEEHRADVIQPDGATLLEVAQNLEVHKGVEFKSAQRLHDGMRQFKYVETANSSAGMLVVPEEFVLGVPIFVDGPAYQITALLRYRIDDGKLAMWFDLHAIKTILDTAFGDIEAAVGEGIKMPVLRGKLA